MTKLEIINILFTKDQNKTHILEDLDVEAFIERLLEEYNKKSRIAFDYLSVNQIKELVEKELKDQEQYWGKEK